MRNFLYADRLTDGVGQGDHVAADLGNRVREARVANGFGLRELAKRVAISPTHLSDIENDRRVPSEGLLRALAETLHLDFDDLMVMAGKVYSATEQYVRQVPEAVTLFRKVSEHNLSPEELRTLEAQAERLARRRRTKKT